MNTPGSCFLSSIRAVLEGMTESVWDPEREMTGYRLGERPDLLFDSGNKNNGSRPKLAGSIETTKSTGRWKKLPTSSGDLGSLDKHLAKELQRKPENRTRSSCFG